MASFQQIPFNFESINKTLEVSTSEASLEKIGSQEIFIKQLKENNKVLKDLIRNKNKEVVALENKLKQDKLEYRKELLKFKAQVKANEKELDIFKSFIKDLLNDFFGKTRVCSC